MITINFIKTPAIFVCLLTWSVFSHAEQKLVFPASKIEKKEHVYELDPQRKIEIDPRKVIDSELLASSLLTLLEAPSKSCQETAITKTAYNLLKEVAAPLAIDIKIDDLPNQITKMTVAKKTGLSCNSGLTAPESGNLVAFIPATISAPSWNLSFHLDTNQLLFDAFIREGDIIRPDTGTPLGADDKAGIAIVAEILRVISKYKLAHGDIRIVGLVAKEDTAVGAELVDAEAFKSDILVSIDGTNADEIGRAAPSMYGGYITVETQTSHPAEVDAKLSVSACAMGAEFLREAGFRHDVHPPGHPNVVLHSYFTSCGLNKGLQTVKGEPLASYQYNTISPFWTAAWQMRNLEGDKAAKEMVDTISSTLEDICEHASTARSHVECKITGNNTAKLTGYIVAEDAASVQLLKLGFDATGEKPVVITAKQFGGFNGNFIKARFDEEMIIVGTGADQIHTNEETVSITGMARVAAGVLAAMLESYRYKRVDELQN
jgi:di/tripeptidase